MRCAANGASWRDAVQTAHFALTLAYGDRTTIETLRASHAWMGPGFERVLNGLRLAGMAEK